MLCPSHTKLARQVIEQFGAEGSLPQNAESSVVGTMPRPINNDAQIRLTITRDVNGLPGSH